MSATEQRKVGPYVLEELLAKGGMGEVYRAHDARLHREVAIKHIRPEVAHKADRHVRFRREAWTVARLNHPVIVQIFDILEEHDGDWIVMELVEGITLHELLKEEGPFEASRALVCGRALAGGLAEAHKKGVVHRDLKAENVMITTAGHVKILDFGLAKPLFHLDEESSISVAGEVMGTCRTMSPEQARGLEVDPRSDLFSLGVLLYELSTGTSPFQAATPIDTLTRVLNHRPPAVLELKPALPPAFSSLVAQLLEKAPEQRPQSAEEVDAVLADLMGTSSGQIPLPARSNIQGDSSRLPTVLETFPSLEPAAPPLQSNQKKWWFVAGAAAILLLALVGQRLLTTDSASATSPVMEDTPSLPALADDAGLLYQQGMALLDRYDKPGHVDRAMEAFQRILVDQPNSAPAHAGLARAYWWKAYAENMDKAWLDQALSVARRAVELDEHLAAAHLSLGKVLASLEKYEEAIAEFDSVLLLDPAQAAAHLGLGTVYEARGELEAAETSYRRALELETDTWWFYNYLGGLLFRTARYQEAEEVFRHGIELAPDAFLSYRNLSAAVAFQGRYDEASSLLQRALEIRPDSSLYTNLGTYLYYQGLYSQSAKAFEQALETSGGANLPFVWGNLGDAYRWTPGKEEEAKEAYLRAIQLLEANQGDGSESMTRTSRLALYRARRGDCSEAKEHIVEVGEPATEDVNVWYRLLMANEACGDRGAALEALRRILEVGYPLDEIRRDPDLFKLRADPSYHRLEMRAASDL